MPGLTPQRGGRLPLTTVPVRGGHAPCHVEMVLVWAVLAMLGSRAVLGTWVDAWPRVEEPNTGQLISGTLFMLVALLLTLSFMGSTMKRTAAVVGGLGCGLLIGTTDDFIAAYDDVFWRSVVTLMYAAFVATVIGMRCLRDRHSPTSRENLASAAAIAARGVADGLDSARRLRALRLLERAANQGGDRSAVVDLSRLISRCPEAEPTATSHAWWKKLATASLAGRIPTARWVSWAVCIVLLVRAMLAVLVAVVAPDRDRFVAISVVSDVCQVLSGISVVALVLAALVRLRRHRLVALRLGRYAALITVLTTGLFDFSAEGFAVLSDIMIGLLVLAVLIQQIRVLAPDPLA
ncbi:hypothetical protein HUW46_07574 [Amycolatopsis sp. CA-230715]|nr:hypothetical protein HUW46_07574 [Amycolatopsis sp. CA-230715]